MIHFFERMEKDIDFLKEYKKLEKMISFEKHVVNGYDRTIDYVISQLFLEWKKRENYTSLGELRRELGFSLDGIYDVSSLESLYKDIGMNEYFLFCEMFINLVNDLKIYLKRYTSIIVPIRYINETIGVVLDKSGFELRQTYQGYFIVEKDAVAIEVASKNPALSDLIIEYNAYLLKGNIIRKREILKHIADALEPEKTDLAEIYSKAKENFFFMVNNMNIRHNNEDPKDKDAYNPLFASLNDQQKEDWYDKTYEQALYLFVLLNSVDRDKDIKQFRLDTKKAKGN